MRPSPKTKDRPDGAMVARSPPKVEVDGSSPSSVDIFALQPPYKSHGCIKQEQDTHPIDFPANLPFYLWYFWNGRNLSLIGEFSLARCQMPQ